MACGGHSKSPHEGVCCYLPVFFLGQFCAIAKKVNFRQENFSQKNFYNLNTKVKKFQNILSIFLVALLDLNHVWKYGYF